MYKHESFWVVAGTAGPVIAVALTVVISDVIRKTNRMPIEAQGQFAVSLSCYFIAGFDFLAMMFLLLFSLFSLAEGSDYVSTLAASTMGGGGLVGVVILTITSAFIDEQDARQSSD